MKYVSIIIALVFLFTASHVNATKPKGLKSQDATDIAPNPEHKTQYKVLGRGRARGALPYTPDYSTQHSTQHSEENARETS